MEHSVSGNKIGCQSLPFKKVQYFAVFFLILPFGMMFWLCPFASPWTLGNDYAMFPIQHQLELMFSIETGSFPLFVPGFSGGQTSSALTLSQIYHPISHMASLLPKYWGGKALEWNTFLRLVSLGLAHFSLFVFLRYLKVATAVAFVLSFITVYNLRMLDLFRYGASLESWTGFLFLVSTIGFQYLRPTALKGPLLIVCSTYWLVCSGHPQMMFYSMCGAALFTVILPYFVAALPDIANESIAVSRRFWLEVIVAVIVGVFLSAAYIAPFYYEFLVDNAGRVGRDYNFAVSFIDTFAGTINNFFQPLRSDVHGVFGGSSLFLIAAFIPLLRVFGFRMPLVIWGIWGAALLVFLHMQGPRTLVHYFTWKYFPFASSIRVPGRLSLILPMLILLLLTWVVQKNEETKFGFAGRRFQLSSKAILAAISFVAIGIYSILPETISNLQTDYSAFAIRNIPPWVEPTAISAGLAGLILFALYKQSSRPFSLGALLGLFVGLQAACFLAYGTWVVPKSDTTQFAELREEKKRTLDYRHLPGSGLYSSTVMRHVRHTHLEPYIAKFYQKVISASDGNDAYRLLKKDRRANLVIVEGCADCGELYMMPQDAEFIEDRVELVYSSYNRLEFEVSASSNGVLGLAFPYSGRWKAFINRREVPVYRANGAANGVQLQSGVSRVEFRYWSPAAIVGMLLSCVTASLIGIFLSVFGLRNPFSVLGVVVAVAGGIGFFALWYHSLYTGGNLNTEYVWTTAPDNGPLNLAYGKPTRTSRILRESYPNFFYSDQFLTFNCSGKAVDGNRQTGSGFVSNAENKPYWYVDLNQSRDIGSIVMYENQRSKLANQRPLLVGLSDNGKEWRTAAVIRDTAESPKLTIHFEPVEKARFLLLQSATFCHLAIDEVEIYPPSHD